MTLFVVLAALLLGMVLWVVLRALLRSPSEEQSAQINHAQANLELLRHQLVELDDEFNAGKLTAEQYAEARTELERRTLDENASVQAANSGHDGRRAIAIMVLTVLPLAAGLLYWQLGDRAGFNRLLTQAEALEQPSEAELQAVVSTLEQRVSEQPDNPGAWGVLARSLYMLQRFEAAARAYERLAQLTPDDASVLVDQADALAMAQGRRFDGQPRELVAQALKIDPTYWKALAMAGTDAFEQKNYAQAAQYWQALSMQLPPDSPIAQQMKDSIAEAQARAADAAPTTKIAANSDPKTANNAQLPVVGATAFVSGRVSLAPALAAQVAPEDTVFVFARAVEGPRMPLAIIKLKVKDLPADFLLNDAMAMAPGMTLSSFPKLVVGARVSKSGRATPSKGDLEGNSTPVVVGAQQITVTIDRVVP